MKLSKIFISRVLLLLIFLISFSFSSENISSDKSILYTHVSKLVNSSKPRCYENTDILDSIAGYIKEEFKKYGFEDVSEQSYVAKEKTYKNVIASVGPQNTDLIVIGAHYDVYGNLPGADDNASGVAGLLACARIIYQHKEQLKNRVQFVAYSLEEPPFFRTCYMGSYVHATFLSDNFVKVKLMICLEMIGYFSDKKNSQDYPLGILKPFYGSKGNYIATVANFKSGKFAKKLTKVYNKQTALKSKYLITPSRINGIDFSDHRNYWGYNFPAIMVTDGSFYRNKNYHTSEDTIETLSFDKMVQVVNGVVLFVLQ